MLSYVEKRIVNAEAIHKSFSILFEVRSSNFSK